MNHFSNIYGRIGFYIARPGLISFLQFVFQPCDILIRA